MSEVELYYDKKSMDYDDIFDILYFKIYDEITWKYLEPYIPSHPGAIVLDAAGGTGRWSIRMAKKGCNVTLLDISEKMLNIAYKKVGIEGLQHRIVIEKGDICKLNYQDETFDLILCEHALFLLEEPEVALTEFARVLKKGAPLIISAPNRYVQSLAHLPCTETPTLEKLNESLEILLQKKHNTMACEGKVKIYSWTPNEFHILLERSGFHVEKIIGKGITMPLRLANEVITARDCSEEFFSKLVQLELYMCDKPDSLALAGHLQAVAKKV